MSFFHALEDGLLNEILHDLRLLKAVGGTLTSASVSGDALEEEEVGSLACLVHTRANNIMQTLLDLESKGGVKSPDLSAPEPEPTPRKLNHYTPGLANAKVSVAAMWGYLEDLELAADDPAKVMAWTEMIHDELEKCEAA